MVENVGTRKLRHEKTVQLNAVNPSVTDRPSLGRFAGTWAPGIEVGAHR
jgi:hypothetical protein